MAVKSLIKQVTEAPAGAEGMGVVLGKLPNSSIIIPMYPCYHMPHNPQDTLGLPALKFYSRMRSVRLEALSWLKLVTEKGASMRTTTIPHYNQEELLDYIMLDVIKPTIILTPPPTIINSTK